MAEENTGWVKLFVNGVQVTVPINPNQTMTIEQATNIRTSIESLMAAGFTTDMVGTSDAEDGETIEEMKYFVRREKEEDDGRITPIIDMYGPNAKFRTMGMYLNEDVDVEAFELATGLSLNSMPVWQGNPIERGAAAKSDKFFSTADELVKVAFKPNPYYTEGAKKPKRKFSRWMKVNIHTKSANGSAPTEAEVEWAMSTVVSKTLPLPKEFLGKTFAKVEGIENSTAVIKWLAGKVANNAGVKFIPETEEDKVVAKAAQILSYNI